MRHHLQQFWPADHPQPLDRQPPLHHDLHQLRWPEPPTTILYPNGQTRTITYDKEGENSLTNSGTTLISNIRYNAQGYSGHRPQPIPTQTMPHAVRKMGNQYFCYDKTAI